MSGPAAPLAYVAGFLLGVARSAADGELAQAADGLAATGSAASLLRLLHDRLASRRAL